MTETPYNGGIASQIESEEEDRKVAKKATKWQDNVKRSNIWMTGWKEEEWKEAHLKSDVSTKSP